MTKESGVRPILRYLEGRAPGLYRHAKGGLIVQFIVNVVSGLFSFAFWIALFGVALAWWTYNKLRPLGERVKESWANVTVAARKKVATLNQLSDVVKAYQNNENLVMLKLSEDATMAALEQANAQSGAVLSAINGMAQRFPDLKASRQYTNLSGEVAKCEQDLEHARVNYNAAVREYNTPRTQLPHVLYAGLIGFRVAPYLTMEATEGEGQSVQKPLVSDDGEQVRELMSRAGSKMLGAARTAAEQGRLLAEKGAARVRGSRD